MKITKMSSEALIEMLRTDRLTEEHVRQLDRLIADHPWFAPARFLRLKALHQLGKLADSQEKGLAAVLSGDRSHLYSFIRGEVEKVSGISGGDSSELEFITGDEGMPGENDNLLMFDDEVVSNKSIPEREEPESDEAASEKSIPEKEDDEMEEPEIDEAVAIPVGVPPDEDEDEGHGEEGSVPFIDPPDDEIYEEGDAGVEEANSVPVIDSLVGREGIAGTGEEPERQEHSEHSDSGQLKQQESGHPVQQEHMQPVPTGVSNGDSSNQSIGLIEQFLNSDPGVIKADKQSSLEGDVSERSVREDDSFITNTLAKIYVKQGLHAKAIYAYERLSLKYPEKSAYFAAQIEKIKNNTNI